jgi:tetratricopeptide (TPR) repeat protein
MRELRQFPPDPSLQRYRADMALVLANLTELVAPAAEALEAYQEAERYFVDLVHANAADQQARASLARCLRSQGLLLLKMRQDAQARERLEEALAQWAISIDHASRRGTDPPSRRTIGEACYAIERGLATLEQRAGNKIAAKAALEKARKLAEDILRELAGKPAERTNFAYWASELAELTRNDRPDEARSLLQQACDIYGPTVADDTFNLRITRDAARAFFLLAGLDDKANRAAEALREYEKAVALFERLAARSRQFLVSGLSGHLVSRHWPIACRGGSARAGTGFLPQGARDPGASRLKPS